MIFRRKKNDGWVVKPRNPLPIKERVAAGLEFLDGRIPHWFDRVKPFVEVIDISKPDRCPSGLLYGDYRVAQLAWGLDALGMANLGFRAYRQGGRGGDAEYDALTREWHAQLGEGDAK